jgi:Zn-dependent peptidase ImmA (M78 family)
VRAKAGFDLYEPLDCFAVANALDIFVYRLSEYGPFDAVSHLLDVEPDVFSAATVRSGDDTAIVVNDAHSRARVSSNLAHELGHVVLEHQDAPPLNDHGCREHHADVEAEADYFASVLLVPDRAVMRAARAGLSVAESAAQLGVSQPMMQWRWNDAGAKRRLQRERGLS